MNKPTPSNMGLLRRLCARLMPPGEEHNETSDETPNEKRDELACNLTGHQWGEGSITAYYSRGVPHFGSCRSFTVVKEIRTECSKCGDVQFNEHKIGTVRVDKETDELTVVQ